MNTEPQSGVVQQKMCTFLHFSSTQATPQSVVLLPKFVINSPKLQFLKSYRYFQKHNHSHYHIYIINIFIINIIIMYRLIIV